MIGGQGLALINVAHSSFFRGEQSMCFHFGGSLTVREFEGDDVATDIGEFTLPDITATFDKIGNVANSIFLNHVYQLLGLHYTIEPLSVQLTYRTNIRYLHWLKICLAEKDKIFTIGLYGDS